jgi:N-methylhydantoinase B
VPQDFDAIGGAEAEVEAKGPMLMMSADEAWEWTGANAPGFGDPLARDPGLMEADVATGALPTDTAERVYGVVPGDGATQKLRAERLPARLADAIPAAGPPATIAAGVPLRVLAGELALVERDGRPEAFVTVTGRAVLAPATGLRVDSETIPDSDEALHDIVIGGTSAPHPAFASGG